MAVGLWSQMNPLLVQAIFAAVLGMFQFGFNTGVINSPQGSIEGFIKESYADRGRDLSDGLVSTLFSLAVSAALVGGMIGGLSGGLVADKFGRKMGLLYTQSFSVTGGILMGVCKPANSYELLIIGRFLIGVACGLFTGLTPTYITEISPVSIRGGIGVCNQLAVTFGIFLSQILGLDIILGSDSGWPWLLSLGCIIPSAIQILMLPFLPESPMFLIFNKNMDEEGLAALCKLRKTREAAEIEYQDMTSSREKDQATTQDTISVWQVLVRKQYRLALLIAVMMHLSQQLSGMVAIFYYSTGFFEDAGVPKDNAQYATLGVGAIMVTMTFVTIPLMDRLGRRTLHLTGLAGIVVFCVLITVAQNLDPSSNDGVGVFLIVSTLGFVVFFALGPGSIPWLITGELFAQGPRPAATAIVTAVNWLANLAVGLLFPLIAESDIGDYSFVPFAVIVLVLFGLLWVYLPETKGKPVEEVVEMLQGTGASRGAYNKRSSMD